MTNVEGLVAANREASGVLQNVTAQTVRMSRLVGDLRKIAEVETQPWAPAAVDVPEVVDEIAAAAAGYWGRQIAVTLPRAPWPVPAVWGDRDLVFLLLYNLVANAMKFSRPEDTVEVRAFDDSPWVSLEVADTGAGIPEDELGLVWEELARGRNARALPGTGLGLPLVRTIVARHGGHVTLRSREGRARSSPSDCRGPMSQRCDMTAIATEHRLPTFLPRRPAPPLAQHADELEAASTFGNANWAGATCPDGSKAAGSTCSGL